MEEIKDPDVISGIARGLGSPARVKIIKFLSGEGQKTLTEIYNHLKDEYVFQTLQNHCRVLAEEGIVEMKREKGRYVVRLKKIPHVFIEEVD